MTDSTLSLADLLRLSFSDPLQWLTEETAFNSGENCEIHWVVLNPSEAQAGDLLLQPAHALTHSLLTKASQNGIAALLLIGNYTDTLPELTIEIPVIMVTNNDDIRAAQRTLLTVLINQRAAVMERGMRIYAQLSQLSADGAGLDGLAHAMTDISGHGIVIQDKRLTILAETASPALASIWEDICQQLLTPSTLPESFRDRKQAGQQANMLTQPMPGGIERIIIPITVGEVARGYLSLIGIAGEMDALDQLVAEQGASVCAVEMARNKAVREAEKRLKGDLLTALLQESFSPRDARLWAQSMDLDLTQTHVAMRFAWEGTAIPSRRRLETLINGEVTRLGFKTIVSPMGVEVVCFFQMPPTTSRPETALGLGAAILEQGRREYPTQQVLCGMGTPASDLSAWRSSFRQAGQALEMARRLGEHNPLYFPDLSIYRLLLQIEHNPELMAFQEEILGPLLAHESGRELIHTLQAYFEHNGNLSQTAEALFIHRNTLIYRLERIATITHLNWDEPETRLAVQLALHIFRMMGAKPS